MVSQGELSGRGGIDNPYDRHGRADACMQDWYGSRCRMRMDVLPAVKEGLELQKWIKLHERA